MVASEGMQICVCHWWLFFNKST